MKYRFFYDDSQGINAWNCDPLVIDADYEAYILLGMADHALGLESKWETEYLQWKLTGVNKRKLWSK